MSRSVGTVANASAKSAIQVVPIMARSGVLPPAIAVWILLCAASQGIAVNSTFTSGLAFWNSFTNSGSSSPSVPIAQMVMSPVAGSVPMVDAAAGLSLPASSERPQPARVMLAVSTMARAPSVVVLFTLFLLEHAVVNLYV